MMTPTSVLDMLFFMVKPSIFKEVSWLDVSKRFVLPRFSKTNQKKLDPLFLIPFQIVSTLVLFEKGVVSSI